MIVNYLQQRFHGQDDTVVVSIYCEYKREYVQSPQNLIANIWRQLSHHHPEISNLIEDIYKSHDNGLRSLTFDEVRILTVQAIGHYAKIFIIIDAIDEYTGDNGIRAKFTGTLQTLLTDVSSCSKKIQVLCTAREATSYFEGADVMEICTTSSDLERFIKTRFRDGTSLSKNVVKKTQADEGLETRLIDAIRDRADHMYVSCAFFGFRDNFSKLKSPHRFLLARLHLDALQSKTNLRDFSEAVHNLPQNLDDTYDEAWTRINNQDPDSKSLAHTILCWICCAERHLGMDELLQILAIRQGDTDFNQDGLVDEETCLRCCQGLVVSECDGAVVCLVHYTAVSYFSVRKSEYFPNAQKQLSDTCLTYLMFATFQDGPTTASIASSRYPSEGLSQLHERLEANPFLSYAASFWGNHVRGDLEETLQCQILAFLRHPRALASSVQVLTGDDSFAWRLGTHNMDSRLSYGEYIPLHVVVYFRLQSLIQPILSTPSIDLELRDHCDRTALMWALTIHEPSMARELLRNGAGRRAENSEDSVLSLAMANSYHELVTELISGDGEGLISPRELKNAVWTSSDVVVRRYMMATSDIVEKRVRCSTVLRLIVQTGGTWNLSFVLDQGGDFKETNEKGITILSEAVAHANEEAVRVALRADPSASMIDLGSSLLLEAAASNEIFVRRLKLLLHAPFPKKFIQEREEDYDQEQLKLKKLLASFQLPNIEELDFAREYLCNDDQQISIILQLLERGADMKIKTPHQESVLHLASVSAPRVDLFLAKGQGVLEINSRDSHGRTPLHHAAAAGNTAAMRSLVSAGADPQAIDDNGSTILHLSARSFSNIRFSLDQGVNINSLDKMSRTVLHYVTMMNIQWQPDTPDLVAEFGIDDSIKDASGNMAAAYAMDLDRLSLPQVPVDADFEKIEDWLMSVEKWSMVQYVIEHHRLESPDDLAGAKFRARAMDQWINS